MHSKRHEKHSTTKCFHFTSLNIHWARIQQMFRLHPNPHLHLEYLPVTTVPKVWAMLLPSYHYKCSSHPQRFGRHNSNTNHKKQGRWAKKDKVSSLRKWLEGRILRCHLYFHQQPYDLSFLRAKPTALLNRSVLVSICLDWQPPVLLFAWEQKAATQLLLQFRIEQVTTELHWLKHMQLVLAGQTLRQPLQHSTFTRGKKRAAS